MASATPAYAYTAYVSNEKGNSITVIDTDKLEATATVKVGRRPRGIELNKDGSELYICAGDDDTIQVLDTKTLKITGKLPSGPDPELLALSPGRRDDLCLQRKRQSRHADRREAQRDRSAIFLSASSRRAWR